MSASLESGKKRGGTRPPPLTLEAAQWHATDPAQSCWVNASAGTGKTTVLSARVLRLLLAGTPPERILCLTYTKAAAAEMQTRLRRRLQYWSIAPETDLAEELCRLDGVPPEAERLVAARQLFARILEAQGGLRFQTIHAFCQSVLRRFPLEASVPPAFTPLDERAAAALERRAMNETLAAAQKEAGIKTALQTLSLGSEDALEEIRENISKQKGALAYFLTKNPQSESWPKAMEAYLGCPSQVTEESYRRNALKDAALPLSALRQWIAAEPRRAAGLANFLNAEDRAALYQEYRKLFLTSKDEDRDAIILQKTKQKHPELDAVLRAEAARLLALEDTVRCLRTKDQSLALLTLAEAFFSRYAAAKEREGVLDFNDLIEKTLALLEKPTMAAWVLYKLDGGLDHLLIDEAQDTSPSQWAIVNALVSEFFAGNGARDAARTLFVVGDDKQSIYSFHGAVPNAFHVWQEHFAKAAAAAKRPLARLALATSFRTVPAVMAVVDATFAPPTVHQGVAASPPQHRTSRVGQGGTVILEPLSEPADRIERRWWVPGETRVRAPPSVAFAASVADKIAKRLKDPTPLPARARPALPGDILVLVPKRSGDFFQSLVRALKQRGIPVSGVDRLRLNEQLAVQDLLALLDFLLLPEDDVNLAAILRGPLIGLLEDADGHDPLLPLARDRGDKSLWQQLKAQEGDKAYAAAAAYLSKLLARADFDTPAAMLSHLLDAPCPADPVSGLRAMLRRLGPEARDPLQELLGLALTFAEQETASLQHFLAWIRGNETEVKRELSSARGQVRVMTIHGAKGLEAPIVILPDTVRRSTAKDRLFMAADGTPFYAVSTPEMPKAVRYLKKAAEQKTEEEGRRTLYVAMTRAEDELIITGLAPARGEEKPGSFYSLIRAGLESLPETRCEADGNLIYHLPQNPQTAPDRRQSMPAAPASAFLPAWAMQPVSAPSLITAGPLKMDEGPVLSPLAADGSDPWRRGTLIHRLLQSLPAMPERRWPDAGERYLAQVAADWPVEMRAQILAEVLAVLRLPEMALLFGPESRAEVPVSGTLDGRHENRRIDRLVIRKDAILILDYKTNRPSPAHLVDIPAAYRQQMAVYRGLLAQLFPARPIHAFLLWTEGPSLMRVPDEGEKSTAKPAAVA